MIEISHSVPNSCNLDDIIEKDKSLPNEEINISNYFLDSDLDENNFSDNEGEATEVALRSKYNFSGTFFDDDDDDDESYY
ncbi:8497_t:CDS:2 [Acaulospora morrowiae]|uniref:8497_t:CDS:1 n=1 Tax=Acaulospora morrowiae TaxID=94023 RepID=A0A9N9BBG4_9GLOM|nr:8497_t:CDS:2 [Acaulospora morrowiae]